MRRVLVGLLLIGGWLGWVLPGHAQELRPTATPDAAGNIYVVVEPNDSMWSIAARAGISLATLLELNGLTESSIVRPGDRLLVGRMTPEPTATVAPTTTPTRLPPTATSPPLPPPQTAVCLAAFVDHNQNGILDPDEPWRAAVAFTLFNEQAVVANYITDGLSEPHCLNLAPGTYRITRSVGRDETLTNDGDVAVLLNRGNVVQLAFGSYDGAGNGGATAVAPSLATLIPTPAPTSPANAVDVAAGESPATLWLLAAGIMATLFAAGVLFLAIRQRG
jgi:hypothetical protein